MMVQTSSEGDSVSTCHQELGLDPDATFSDIRNSYQSLPSLTVHMETQKSENSPQNNVYFRLLAEFLRDPDIKAQWAVTATNNRDDIQTYGNL